MNESMYFLVNMGDIPAMLIDPRGYNSFNKNMSREI